MSHKKQLIDDLFILPDCSIYKKYKVYCIKDFAGNIIYIGCTMCRLRTRMNGHLCDTFRLPHKLSIVEEYRRNNKKFIVNVLYDFSSKEHAGITERLLINFYKTHINASLLNTKAKFGEEYFTSLFSSIRHY